MHNDLSDADKGIPIAKIEQVHPWGKVLDVELRDSTVQIKFLDDLSGRIEKSSRYNTVIFNTFVFNIDKFGSGIRIDDKYRSFCL